jgi:serine/threonine protein kinase
MLGFCEVFSGQFKGGFEVAVKLFKQETPSSSDTKSSSPPPVEPPATSSPASGGNGSTSGAVATSTPHPHASYTDDLRREIDVLRKCRHDCLVSYYGCYGPDSKQRLWVLMEYCDGGSLLDLLPRSIKAKDAIRRKKLQHQKTTISDSSTPTGSGGATTPTASSSPTESATSTDIPLYWWAEEHVQYILACTLQALSYLHKQGIVHRGMPHPSRSNPLI